MVLTPPIRDDQRETIAFLGRADSYGPAVERVEIIETHVSLVFLAGERAYKLKRAVKLPYLDFSTARRRGEACAAELSLNRRTAPMLYLETRRLGRDPAGLVCFGEQGPEIDWVVAMRRFDQALLFDALARAAKLDPGLIDRLADHIAQFHACAPSSAPIGAAGRRSTTSPRPTISCWPRRRRPISPASGSRRSSANGARR